MADLTDQEAKAKADALAHPLFVPEDFKGYLEDFASRVATDFFIKEAQGFREGRFASAAPRLDDGVCNNTTTWADLSSGGTGPEINHLSNGLYMFFFGFETPGGSGYISSIIEINHIAPTVPFVQEEEQELRITAQGNAWRTAVFEVKNDANDNYVKMIYQVGTAGVIFRRRWLHALKIREL